MTRMTITEALAEIKTISKRVEKKRGSITKFLGRQDGLRDPLEKDGGSRSFILRETQSIQDLLKRLVSIRTAIQRVNLSTSLTVEGETHTIQEWLTWKKEVAPGSQSHLLRVQQGINTLRTQAVRQGLQIVTPGATPQGTTDFLINVDEGALAKEAERVETILGVLDGQLSLKNATIMVEVEGGEPSTSGEVPRV